jgi:hypothetical protein
VAKASDDLITQGAQRRNWKGKMILVRLGTHTFMRMPEDEALARGYTPFEPEQKMAPSSENKMAEPSENKGRRRSKKTE